MADIAIAKFCGKEHKMSNFNKQIDYAEMESHIRRAHVERADALAHAFASAGRQIKNLFSSPEPENGCASCGSNA